MCRKLGALVAGAPTPLIATALLAKYGDYTPIAFFAMIAAGITLVCALIARGTPTTLLARPCTAPR